MSGLCAVVREILKEEFQPIAEGIGSLEKEIRVISNNFDNIQMAVRKVKQDSAKVKQAVDMLQDKTARLEDNSHQCIGLKERERGSDPVGFMQTQLSLWILSLKNRSVEIERALCIYASDSNRKGPRTLIFKLLRFQDRNSGDLTHPYSTIMNLYHNCVPP